MVNSDDLISRHQQGLKGILNKYTSKKFYTSKYIVFCIVLTCILKIVPIISSDSSETIYKLIEDISSTVLSAFPSLLGFSLAGYALIIGTINIGVMRRMSEPRESMGNLSFFQFVSSVFALSVLIQCVTLLVAFIIHVVLKQEWEMLFGLSSNWVNIPVYGILLFLVLESLVLLGNMVVNIFSYGQSVHLCLRVEEELPRDDSSIWDEVKDCIKGVVRKLLNSHD